MHGEVVESNTESTRSRISVAFLKNRVRLAVGALVFSVGVVLLLIGDLLQSHDHMWSVSLGDVGGLLAGSVAVAVVYDIFVKPSQQDEIVSIVETRLTRPIEDQLKAHEDRTLSRVTELEQPIEAVLSNQRLLFSQRVTLEIRDSISAGFLGVVPTLDFADRVFRDLGEDDELLWMDTYCPPLSETEDALFDAIRAGTNVKMLAIDPDAETCSFRADEIKEVPFNVDVFREEARQSLQHLKLHAAQLDSAGAKGSIEVRLYRTLPGIPMYLRLHMADLQVGYTSFFLTRATFREPHIAWGPSVPSEQSGFLERFEEYFRCRWNLAEEPTPSFLLWPPGNQV